MSEEEDRRTHAQYVSDTGEKITFAYYCRLREMWQAFGGKIYGPNVETWKMPESTMLGWFRILVNRCEEDLRSSVNPSAPADDHE